MTWVCNVSVTFKQSKQRQIQLITLVAPLVGFPQIIYFGDHEDGDEKIMIMEMLGPNLDKIFIAADLNFSLERVRWIAKQVVSNISLHTAHAPVTIPWNNYENLIRARSIASKHFTKVAGCMWT